MPLTINDEGGFGAVSDGAMLDELVKPLFERLALRVHFDFHFTVSPLIF